MKLTTNYSLKKPDGADVVNIDDFNYNADLLDSKMKTIENQSNTNKNNITTLQSETSTNKTNITSNTNLINNYKNRLNDGYIDTKSIDYIIENYKSGSYYLFNCTGFPYGWGGLQMIKYNSNAGCLVYHNLEYTISNWGTYVNYFKDGKLKGWQKLAIASTYSLLEEQVSELEIQALERGM